MSAKKTNEQIQSQLESRGIRFLKDVPTKGVRRGLFQCEKGHQWDAKIVSVTNSGNGCPECAGKKRLTVDDINLRLRDRGINIISGFTTVNKKALFECPEGHQWETLVLNVLARSGCGVCATNQLLTKEEVAKRLSKRGIVLLSEYTGTKDIGHFRCINGHEWKVGTGSVLQGDGCAKCSGVAPLTAEIINERIWSKGIELVGEYRNSFTKALFRCAAKDHTWMALPNGILGGYGCPKCSGRSVEGSKEGFLKAASKRGYRVLGEYEKSRLPVDMLCPLGHHFKMTPYDFKSGRGCSHCSQRGFNHENPCFFYVYRLEKDGLSGIGFGVTNVFKRRESKHNVIFKKNDVKSCLIGLYRFNKGMDALSVENHLKKLSGKINMGIEAFKTECLSIESEEYALGFIETSGGVKTRKPSIHERLS